MTTYLNTAETGLSDESAATTANTGNGSAGKAFTAVTLAATGTVKYDTAHAHRGDLSYRFDAPVSGDVGRLDYTISGTEATWEPYIYLTAYPAVEQPILHIRNATAAIAAVQITAAGNCRLYDATPTALWLSTSPLPLNRWVRLHLEAIKGTNASSPFNGTIRFKYFVGADLETTNPTETTLGATFFSSMTETTVNTGTVNFTSMRVGKVGSGGVWTGVSADDVQWDDSVALDIGPVAINPALCMESGLRLGLESASGPLLI